MSDDFLTGEGALKRLVDGNRRFVSEASVHGHTDAGWRDLLTDGQKPFATILGCSDSRVPVELLFDQGFGDLFVVRVAGNVTGIDQLGSIAFAVQFLHTTLVLILGHEACGAVTAAMQPGEARGEIISSIGRLLAGIEPALTGIDPDLPIEKRIHLGVEANVRHSMQAVRKHLDENPGCDGILVAGAVYELETGCVRILK